MSVPQSAAVPGDRVDGPLLTPGTTSAPEGGVVPATGASTIASPSASIGTTVGSADDRQPVQPAPAAQVTLTPIPPQPVAARQSLPSDGSPADALSVHELRLGILVAVVVLLVASFQWWRLSRGGVWPVRVQFLKAADDHFQLDINACHWAELTQLEGIGDTLAQRIVAYRETHGPFQHVDDLCLVHGIGKKTVDAFRAHVRIGPLSSHNPSPNDQPYNTKSPYDQQRKQEVPSSPSTSGTTP